MDQQFIHTIAFENEQEAATKVKFLKMLLISMNESIGPGPLSPEIKLRSNGTLAKYKDHLVVKDGQFAFKDSMIEAVMEEFRIYANTPEQQELFEDIKGLAAMMQEVENKLQKFGLNLFYGRAVFSPYTLKISINTLIKHIH